jgi:hypothetical protein
MEKISTPENRLFLRSLVLGIVHDGGAEGTVTELLFEKREMIPRILLLIHSQQK